MTDITHTITVKTQTVYSIRNQHEWADISISHGSKSNGMHPCNWVHVTIASSFRAMSYFWNNIGSQHWADFLHDPREKSYMMEKLIGSRESMQDWDGPGSMEAARSYLLEQRKQTNITRCEARDAWDDLSWVDTELGPDMFVDQLGRVEFFRDEPWCWLRYKEKPWIDNFWKTLWVPFTTSLVSDLRLRNAA